MTSLRVGTWNVEYARGVEKNRARFKLIASLRADVWVLTETHDDLDLAGNHTAVRSEQRYPKPGGRWTTIWTSLPIIERLCTIDPQRTVAARLDGGAAGEVIVYGTVLPWNGDTGPDESHHARGWDKFRRATREQGQEWTSLRERYPLSTLVVAGDLNQDLGGPHYYGTKDCRALLVAQMKRANLSCLTTTDRFAPGTLAHPPIDHVCASPASATRSRHKSKHGAPPPKESG